MKLTIQNLDKIKGHTIEPQYGVQYQIDRIVELPEVYRFHWCRDYGTTSEVVMIELSRIPSNSRRRQRSTNEYDNLVYRMRINNQIVYALTQSTLRDVNAVVERMRELIALL